MFGKKRRAEKERMERESRERREIRKRLGREFRESGQIYKVNPREIEQRIENIQTRRLEKGKERLSEPLVERMVYIQLQDEYMRGRLEELGYSQKEIALIIL